MIKNLPSILSKSLIIVCLLLFFSKDSFAQLVFDKQYSPRNANYDIDVTLDDSTKQLTGKETLTWINITQDTIYTLQFHLYLNAFKNSETTFFSESGGQLRGERIEKKDSTIWGWADVKKLEVEGVDLTDSISFIYPDDVNPNDQTVIEVKLAKPIMGGDTIQVNIDFLSKLPKVFARTGFSKDSYYLVAQWFPKIGVWEPKGMRYSEKGAWNCHQFHGNSEFYADYGEYNVRMTVPSDFIVGATGKLQDKKENDDNTSTYHYKALDVIDFAWTASPKYVVVEDQWEGVDIRLLIMPEHQQFADRYITSAKHSLEYFGENVGLYPYSTLTIIDPPIHAMGAGGMEYPTFITGGSFYSLPDGMRQIETVTVHEFGHQYFMGMLASNEFEEPWLDEGFNTYLENRTMDHAYGKQTSVIDLLGFKMGDGESSRTGYVGMSNPKIAENFRPAWGFEHGGYGSLTYSKTGTWLATLEGIVGIDVMNKIMKTYYNRWAFKHPCAKDFIAVVNEVVKKEHGNKYGEDMQWYFDQVLYGTNTCDYSVARIKNEKVKTPFGIYEQDGERVYVDKDNSTEEEETDEETEEEENQLYESSVILYRLGEIKVPQRIRITFDNGDEVWEEWDGKSRTYEFKYTRTEKMETVEIDPDRNIQIDVNLINNSKTTKSNKSGVVWKYFSKVLMSVQSMLNFVSIFV